MNWRIILLPALILAACGSDYQVQTQELPTPLPPIEAENDYGNPPQWAECHGGYHALYYNLQSHDPGIEPPEGEDPIPQIQNPEDLDYFDAHRLAFEDYTATLDMGSNWWPVDQGLSADPLYFATRFIFWVRARNRTTWQVSVGAQNDIWISIDGGLVYQAVGQREFEPQLVEFSLSEGQYPVEVYFAHRMGNQSALQFRPLANEVVDICYPAF